jgi:CspA family cold shock protein
MLDKKHIVLRNLSALWCQILRFGPNNTLKPTCPKYIWGNNNEGNIYLYGAKAQEFNMPTGTVKWFNNAKGYGFILADQGSEDLFAHYSAINMDGYKTLKAGQQVSFEITKGDKGLHAINICAPEGSVQTARTLEESHA